MASPTCECFHLIGFAEHHLPVPALKPLRQKCQFVFKRKLFASPAKVKHESNIKATSGGCLFLAKQHVQLGVVSPNKCAHYQSGHDWVVVPIMLKGTCVLFVTLYLTCNIGLSGENVRKLEQLLMFLRNDGRLFIIAADWNMEPHELARQGASFLHSARAGIVTGQQHEATCISGRNIDYTVVSASLLPAVKVETVLDLPWRTHLGIHVSVHKRPGALRFLSIERPLRLDSDPKKQIAPSTAARYASSDAFLRPDVRPDWHSAISNGKWHPCVGGQPPRIVGGELEDALLASPLKGIVDNARQLGAAYLEWSMKSEQWLMDSMGIPSELQKQFAGRGLPPRVEERPVPVHEGQTQPRHCERAAVWSAIAGRLTLLHKLQTRGRGHRLQHALRETLRTKLHRSLALLTRREDDSAGGDGDNDDDNDTTDPNEQLHDLLWLHRLEAGCVVADDILEGMVMDANALADRADATLRRRINRRIHKWAADAVVDNGETAIVDDTTTKDG